VPLRPGPVFAAMARVTVPLPVPLAAPDTVSHPAFGVTDQAHPVPLVTLKDVVPDAEATDTDCGDSANVHAGAGAAACVIVTVCPATVSVPVRSLPVFGAAVNAIDALPRPLDGELIDSHVA
jgi:hypothetical protein